MLPGAPAPPTPAAQIRARALQTVTALSWTPPPLPEAIAYDPILGSLKLIARPGDEALLPRGGDRGFPHWSVWAELSPRFPCDLGRALNPFPHAQEDLQGSPTIASAIATRCGRRAGQAALGADAWLPCTRSCCCCCKLCISVYCLVGRMVAVCQATI